MYKLVEDKVQGKIDSAKNLARAILRAEGVSAEHKSEFLGDVVWKITEARGKYNTGFMSAGALAKFDKWKKRFASKEGLIHEHVVTKESICSALMALDLNDSGFDEKLNLILDSCVACIVTVNEHKKLAKSEQFGWQRYRDAKIVVHDGNGDAVDLPALHQELGRKTKGLFEVIQTVE